MHDKRRLLKWAGLAALGLAAGGCATLNELPVEVRSFGDWPVGRAAGTFAFDRLPSQQAASAGSLVQVLEDAALPALLAAGFTPAAPGAAPDVLVQLAAQVGTEVPPPWADPIWWRGGWGPWRHGPWMSPSWSLRWQSGLRSTRYDREVALLLRDRITGKPLYEAHASHEGFTAGIEGVAKPLFAAALRGFPAVENQPRTVRVPM